MKEKTFVCKENFKYFYRLFERHSPELSIKLFTDYLDKISSKSDSYIYWELFFLLLELIHFDNYQIFNEIQADFPNITYMQIVPLFKKFLSEQE